jgi:hypothetical protein
VAKSPLLHPNMAAIKNSTLSKPRVERFLDMTFPFQA